MMYNVCVCTTYSVVFMYTVHKKQTGLIVSIALSQLCDCRVGAHLHSHGPEPAVSCRHSSVIWTVGHTSPIYCRCVSGG